MSVTPKISIPALTSREIIRISGGQRCPGQIHHSTGEDSEVTITNYHCSALFVLLGRVRNDACQHGGFDFGLAAVARPET
jgi:hypothetical protein